MWTSLDDALLGLFTATLACAIGSTAAAILIIILT